MQCQILNCNGTANYPFFGCSLEHGLKLKEIKRELKDYQDGESFNDFYGVSWLKKLSINELEYYSKFI